MPPFLAAECEEIGMDCLSLSRAACDEAHNGSVLQGKDHEIINEGAECEWSQNTMQFRTTTS